MTGKRLLLDGYRLRMKTPDKAEFESTWSLRARCSGRGCGRRYREVGVARLLRCAELRGAWMEGASPLALVGSEALSGLVPETLTDARS